MKKAIILSMAAVLLCGCSVKTEEKKNTSAKSRYHNFDFCFLLNHRCFVTGWLYCNNHSNTLPIYSTKQLLYGCAWGYGGTSSCDQRGNRYRNHILGYNNRTVNRSYEPDKTAACIHRYSCRLEPCQYNRRLCQRRDRYILIN